MQKSINGLEQLQQTTLTLKVFMLVLQRSTLHWAVTGQFRANTLQRNNLGVQFSNTQIMTLLYFFIQETMTKLRALADAVDLKGKIDAMFGGEHLNTTEDRAVLHVALRANRDQVSQPNKIRHSWIHLKCNMPLGSSQNTQHVQ